MTRPPIHVVVYGAYGAGKSTFAATFPKPILVFAFDPLGKEAPYRELGRCEDVEAEADAPRHTVVTSRKSDRLLARVEYFHDTEIDSNGVYRPTAYRGFLRRFASVYDEVRSGMWATVVVDTLTFMELTARKLSQYELDKNSREPRRWFAAATDMVEEAVLCRLGGLPVNVVVIGHVDSDKDEVAGHMVFQPAAPGRLRTRLGGGYPEVYVAHARRDRTTEQIQYWLQTRTDARYNASSVFLGAPDPCEPAYRALWTVWDAKHGVDEKGGEAS